MFKDPFDPKALLGRGAAAAAATMPRPTMRA